jgi:diguanylate cyclase (GGDEF)-like protein/PAS domain S-box-containing protein
VPSLHASNDRPDLTITPQGPVSASGRLKAPAQASFAPVGLGVGLVALISLGLLCWSHHSWQYLQRRAQVHQQQVNKAQLLLQNAVWQLEASADLPPAVSRLTLGQALEEARDNARSHAREQEAPSWVLFFARDQHLDVQPLWQRLAEKLAPIQASLSTPTASPQPMAADLSEQLARSLDVLTNIDLALQRQQAETAKRQRKLDLLNLGLIAALTSGVIWRLWRSHRSQRLVAETLQAREAELSAFAGSLPDLAFMMDKDGHYLQVFGNNSTLLGRPKEQLIGRPLSDFFLPEAAQVFMGVIRRALETRQTQSLSYPVRVMGGPRHFDSRCSPVGDSDRVVWTIWDVTARRRAEQRLIHMTRLYDFLSHVSQAIVWAKTPEDLLQRVCHTAIHHGRFKKAWVCMADLSGQRFECRAHAGEATLDMAALSFELPERRSEATMMELAQMDGVSFHCADLSQLPATPTWVGRAVQDGLMGCAVLPLMVHERHAGFLVLLDRQLNTQDQDEKALLDDVATDLSFALANLQKDAERALAEDRIRLHAAALHSSRDGMIVLDRAHTFVSINPAFTEITGYLEEDAVGQQPGFLFPDNPNDLIAEMRRDIRRTGSWQGEAWCQRKSGELFSTKLSVSAVRNNQGLPTHFVAVLTDITQLKQTEARLARMAHYDPLTELPNRSMIHQRLDHAVNLARRHQTLVGVVFVDLDNFKTVNDSLGHAAGDTLLKLVAERLRQRVRQEDTLGRLGGDEFILVLEHLRHPQQAAHVAQAVIDTLSAPFHLGDGQDVYVRASIGISLFPNDGEEASELIRDADAAMYQAKRQGRNAFRFYTESMTSQATDRLQMETRLRRAVEQREFALHYQPIMRMSDRKVVGVEALVRLRVPDATDECLPSIGPDEFIPVMEDTGMIMALGEWVLLEACKQARAWVDAGFEFGRVAVNVSASEVKRGGMIERVSRILKQTSLPPKYLELEITESGLMEHGDMADLFLQQLHQLGVSISIDDFGTGYSSLAYLKRFPVQQLKIDRSFVQDLPGNGNDAQLVSTMISLAHNLKMRVVAEGVEMPDQEAFLAAKGCDMAQGYLFSRPVTAAQVEKFLPRPLTSASEVASV